MKKILLIFIFINLNNIALGSIKENIINNLNSINNKLKARINGVAFLTSRSATNDYSEIAENMNINFLNFINELAYENMGSVVVVK